MSTPPHANPGGFHIVRKDLKDEPNIYNTDSYNEIDLPSHPRWPDILSTARFTEADVEWLLCTYVFVTGPNRRADHHSPHVPDDIAKAQPK